MFKKKKKKTRNDTPPVHEERNTTPVPSPQEDGELIAVLAAAVAAVMGTSANGIVIRSYKRVSPSAWKRSGRDFQIFNHF